MFLNENYLLPNEIAQTLYHDYAKELPIIDYHCHLDPKEIYEDRPFKTITEAWLSGDHYKWRLMRACGVPEEAITGNASDYENFGMVSNSAKIGGKSLYSWTHLELKRFLRSIFPLLKKCRNFVEAMQRKLQQRLYPKSFDCSQ